MKKRRSGKDKTCIIRRSFVLVSIIVSLPIPDNGSTFFKQVAWLDI